MSGTETETGTETASGGRISHLVRDRRYHPTVEIVVK